MKTLRQILSETKAVKRPAADAPENEHDAFNDAYGDTVVTAHVKHIEKKYGKDSIVNFGSGGDDTSITSKVRNKEGRIKYITTHHDNNTLKVLKHTEE
jgi:hypothetical protein